MKAAVVHGKGSIEVMDLPEPTMGEYEARCRMLYGTVCAGTDTHLVSGHAPFCHWVKLPFILGHESVGRVVEVGRKVRNLKCGDVITRVGSPAVDGVTAGWGGFAETGIATDFRAMQEDGVEGWNGKTVQQVLPGDIAPMVGTLFITWRETLSYLTRLGVGPGASVLVIGSGGNGLAFVSHARNLGAARVAVAGSAERGADAKRAGAGDYFDYRDAEACKALTEGFDFVIDSVGKTTTVEMAQRCLKTGGTLGIYGLDEAGQTKLAPGRTFRFYNGGYDEAEAHDAVLRFYRAGKLDPGVWIDRRRVFALAEIAKALEAVRTRELIKPVVRLGEEGTKEPRTK